LNKIPQSLIDSLHGVPGFDEAGFTQAHLQPAVTSIRLHPVKQSKAFADNVQVPWCPQGRYLVERPVFTLDPLYHAGAYYVQEASSMLLHYLLKQVLPTNENLRVLDLCAAPGGKSTLIASLLDESSLLISNEVIRTRASILEENMTRWGYMNSWVTSNDPAVFGKVPGYFDVIVVDAPCSGSGLFRKDARAIDEWSEANVQLCSGRQQRILADVWPALKENGVLIYATCSFSQQEDEEILDWLGGKFEVETINVQILEEWGIVEVNSSRHGISGYRCFPGKAKGEGFFIAALRKKESADNIRFAKSKSENDKKIAQQASFLFKGQEPVFLQLDKETHIAIIPQHEADLQLLRKSFFLRKAGLQTGMPAAKEWIPAHDTALGIALADTISSIDVNREQALRFLKKEEMDTVAAKGWHVVKYEGLGLGWVKSLGNRMNNYLPKHWKIRMNIDEE